MTDATLTGFAPTARAAAPQDPLRAGRAADLPLVHTRLMEAIKTSPFYGDEFKAYEMGRLTPGYLEALLAADPWHVAVMELKGEPAGFMLSGPELGTLWLYWTYVFPEKRKSGIAVQGVRAFVQHWENNRFHKIATYTKQGNEVAEAIMVRLGFKKIAVLEQHIFGEDYFLYERRLTKTVPGYDRGAALGRVAQVKRRLARLLGR
jgi:RimJ/RimL family protein N-acetyltransferase